MKSKTVQEFQETEIGKIPLDWNIMSILDCASNEPYATQIGPFGKALMSSEYTESGVPVLRGINVNLGRFHDNDFVFVSNEKANELKKFESLPEDVLLVHKGTIGKIGLMPSSRKFPRYLLGNSMMRVRCDPKKLQAEFLYLWLSSPFGQDYLYSRISQVGVPQLQTPLTTLREAKLGVPPVSEQQRIVNIIFSLESKIQNLENQNKILEQIAQTIFKSWFVDFDGVTEFEDSELGQIPKGWEVGTLGEYLEITKGVSYKSSELMPSNKALVTLKSIKRHGGYTERGLKSFDGKYKESQIVHENDLIIAQTDLTQDAAVIGKPAIIRSSKEFDILIASLDLLIIRPKDDYLKYYFYYMFMTNEFQNHVYGYTNGTGVLHLAKDGVPSYQCLIPPKEILEKFIKLVSFIKQKTHDNHYQIESLTKTRDILLPKLMSGEIRV